ncbi:MAG: hypothetical protein K8W52_09030 [Deltaproteobacteria bacterium]|nr:hypothetical protein [Deltaproteobacteria bacterium]
MIRRIAIALVIAVVAARTARAQRAAPAPAAPTPAAAPAPAAPAAPPPDAEPPVVLTDLPTGRGLPLIVRVSAAIVELRAIDDRAGTFTATLDLRVRWADPRLADPDASGPPVLLRDADADARLATIWSPQLGFRNQLADPSRSRALLRITATGECELRARLTGQFATPLDLGQFPFDRQGLRLQVVSKRERTTLVVLDVDQDDLGFAQQSTRATLDGWEPVRIGIAHTTEPGWYGEAQDGVDVTLDVARRPGAGVLAIFIPLFAVLMIPLLALWLMRMEDGEFKVAPLDLTNILLGGLFAVIALNFTIGSAYPSLMTGDNTITRLFGLIYLTLGTTLALNIALVRFNLVRRWFGRHVQEQLYRVLVWALPTVTLATAVAVVAASMA